MSAVVEYDAETVFGSHRLGAAAAISFKQLIGGSIKNNKEKIDGEAVYMIAVHFLSKFYSHVVIFHISQNVIQQFAQSISIIKYGLQKRAQQEVGKEVMMHGINKLQ